MNSNDLQQIDELLQKRLKNMVTKDELKAEIKASETKIIEDVSQVIVQFAQTLDEKKADKSQTISLEVRVKALEDKISPN